MTAYLERFESAWLHEVDNTPGLQVSNEDKGDNNYRDWHMSFYRSGTERFQKALANPTQTARPRERSRHRKLWWSPTGPSNTMTNPMTAKHIQETHFKPQDLQPYLRVSHFLLVVSYYCKEFTGKFPIIVLLKKMRNFWKVSQNVTLTILFLNMYLFSNFHVNFVPETKKKNSVF